MRAFLLICAGVTVAGFIGWGMDKIWRKSRVWLRRLRDAFLAGAGVYIALTINSMMK